MMRNTLNGLPTQPRHYDVIVIGSGIGGLTAAGLLARVAGKRVLVLEKHLEPGGLTHAFRRDGASWDVGVHYIGQLEEGSPMRRLFDYLSDGRLRWNRMPEDFEHLILPGVDFRIPSTPQAHQQRLIDAFPDEAKAIRRYFRDIRRAVRWASLGFMQGMVPRPIVPLLKALQWLGRGFGTQTTGHYLQQHFRSPALRALLACRWGDYGLPPAQSAFAIHATIVEHFQGGAWFPAGGSSRIARCIESGIEAAGGAVRVGQQVTRILLDEGGRACGVQVRDLRRPDGGLLDYRAAQIISTIGALPTFRSLLPTEGPIGQRTARLRAQIETLGIGLSAVVLYLRLKDDARSLGVQGENLWISADLDQDDVAGNSQGVIAGKPRWAYISFPSIKAADPSRPPEVQHAHTAEIISFVDPAVFAPWQHTRRGERGAGYAALKERISAGLLKLAETALPGLQAQVSYAELSTPLSVVHYTSHPQGAFYGMPATPARFSAGMSNPRTPIEGLYLGGQDACALGIFGAMMGGLGAACQVLGSRGYPMIQKAIRRAAAKSCQADQKPSSPAFATRFCPDPFFSRHRPLPPDKYPATLLTRRALTPRIWLAEFLIDARIPDFAPGQFARLCVAEASWRDYSIAGLRQADAAEPASSADSADAGDDAPGSPPRASILQLLISTRTGGEGSRFIEGAPLGTQTLVELPLGQYTLKDSARPLLFIATGTGIAPFLPMFGQLARQQRLQHATLLFGCRGPNDDISTMLDGPLPGTVIRCHSRATPGDEAKGTASAALPRAITATSVSPTAQAAQADQPNQALTDSRVTSRIVAGRVTTVLTHLDFEPAQTDVYLCGSAAMVADCQALLLQRGATHVHAEPF